MLEAAQYFQAREDTIDKSVLLYHRAGNLAKAIELVFNYRRFGALENLVEELDKDTDVNVLTRCADFFLENNRHAKAAYLFLLSKEVYYIPYIISTQILVIDINFYLVCESIKINNRLRCWNNKWNGSTIHIAKRSSKSNKNYGSCCSTLLRSNPISGKTKPEPDFYSFGKNDIICCIS